MTKKCFSKLFALVGLILFLGSWPANLSAEPPNLLTYQGRLKESGEPVTGTRSVEIKLCNALSGGACTSTGAQGAAVANGLFRTTFTVPSAVNLETGDWYLKIYCWTSTESITLASALMEKKT